MDNFEEVNEEQRKKVWVTPELEILEVKNTLYWRFDNSGDFPIMCGSRVNPYTQKQPTVVHEMMS